MPADEVEDDAGDEIERDGEALHRDVERVAGEDAGERPEEVEDRRVVATTDVVVEVERSVLPHPDRPAGHLGRIARVALGTDGDEADREAREEDQAQGRAFAAQPRRHGTSRRKTRLPATAPTLVKRSFS